MHQKSSFFSRQGRAANAPRAEMAASADEEVSLTSGGDEEHDDHSARSSRPIRASPRLLEYARRVKPVPKFSAKNAVLIVLLLAGISGFTLGIHLRNTALAVAFLIFLLSWCCCPWCALEREIRQGEQGHHEETQALTSDSGA